MYFFQCGSGAHQLNVNALLYNSALLFFIPVPSPLFPSPPLSTPLFSPPLPSSFNIVPSHSVSWALSDFSPPFYPCLYLFSPLRIVMMAGLSQFSHHLRLICDTQLCQLKPLMAQHSTKSCQNWQSLELCCMMHSMVGRGARKQMYGNLNKITEKVEDVEMETASRIIGRGRNGKMILGRTCCIYICMVFVKGRPFFVDHTKGRLPVAGRL